MIRLFFTLIFVLNVMGSSLSAMVAGGRPNSISGGHNAFAGVVNPANAVWIENRFDFGLYLVSQKSTLNNKDNNPLFNPGKTDLSYKARHICTGDAAFHLRGKIKEHECSFSLATYSPPVFVKVRTKKPIPITGTTPIHVVDRTQAISAIFSIKLNKDHSFGFSIDYFHLSHLRDGFQHSDNPLRSVSPGNVTNNGTDHSEGVGLTFGWRWNITKALDFGFAYIKESHVGQYRKYRGYEPHHAKNYIPASIGGGFTYKFNKQLAGRLEVVWTNFGNLPNANNTISSNGELNRNKRGSHKSPGTGLQNATFLNLGIGYKVNKSLALGLGLSHRFKHPRNSPYIISHGYMRQVFYDLLTFGVNYNYHHHDFFLTLSHGFPNHQKGYMPAQIGGGKFTSMKHFDSLSVAWGYLY